MVYSDGSSMTNVTVAATNVVVELVTTTKDSLHVRWHVEADDEMDILQYEVSYQAIGSTHKDTIYNIQPRELEYNIQMLHESTSYSVCVHVITTTSSVVSDCINAATSSDYLSVSLGSTFGAFIALAIIVMFVMIARCQTNRKLARLQKETVASTEMDPYMVSQNGDIEMSDMSYHIHDDTTQLHILDNEEIQARKELARQQSRDPSTCTVHLYPHSGNSPHKTDTENIYPDMTPDEEKGAVGGVGVSDVIAGAVGGALYEAGTVVGSIGGFEVSRHPYANSPVMHTDMQHHGLPYVNKFTNKPVFMRHNFSF